MSVSIVIPAHNEGVNVPIIFEEITKVLKKSGEENFEVIFVDDGSSDNTFEEMVNLKNRDQRCKAVRLSRNFGHQSALIAGMSAARGDAVITMDCDLQHPPEFIPLMLDNWRRGALIVEMVRQKTEGISFFKNLYSRLFYKLIGIFTSYSLPDGVSDFRLMDRHVANALISLKDPKPFIRGTIAWMGFQPKRFHYVARRRVHGEPSYTVRRSLSLAHKAIVTLSTNPLRFSIYLSFLIIIILLIYLLYVLLAYSSGWVVVGWPSLISSILILGALQLCVLGVIGEYITQIFERVRGLPAFLTYPEDKDAE